MDRPSISLCVIARNEAASIARCLESAREVADEIVVVDAGSEDATPAVAAELGAAVHAFEWRDDFAAARNAALEKARGDWVLWLDADEALLPESRARLRELVRGSEALALLVLREEVEREGDGAPGGGEPPPPPPLGLSAQLESREAEAGGPPPGDGAG